MPPRPAIVWFRRDLRVHDHPALVRAIADGDGVVPVFVVDPALLGGRFASPNRTWFMLRSVAALRTSLHSRGSDLIVRVGDPRIVIPAVAASAGAGAVHVSRDHAPYGRARDRVIADRLAGDGVAWRPARGGLVHEPEDVRTTEGAPFSVYSPFRRAWDRLERRAVLDAPTDLGPAPTLDPGDIPEVDRPTADPARLPEPGEAAARRRLARWVEDGVDGYDGTRDRLDLVDGTSRLSADLRFGLLSPLEVVEAAKGPGIGRRTFANELVWREFYAHILFHEPRVRHAAFHEEFDDLPWSPDDDVASGAWRGGRTGYPIVDAGMRQLAATGWMHNRARMIVATFLTKDLLIDWRVGEAHFMHHLVDGDVASNNGGWQWSASTGTDPQPWFRIFNPVLQGRRHDPDGAYVRRWVPELADVPVERIHAPWEMSDDEQIAAACRIGVDYPAPIVDHVEARVRALATYASVRERRRTS